MNDTYKVYTITDGVITPGVQINTHRLEEGKGKIIPAIVIGSKRYGTYRGVMSIGGAPRLPCKYRNQEIGGMDEICDLCGVELGGSYFSRQHPNDGFMPGILQFASVGKSKSERPKLFSGSQTSNEFVIIVFRSYTMKNSTIEYTGDPKNWECRSCDTRGIEQAPDRCPECGASWFWKEYEPFPGDILSYGCSGSPSSRGKEIIALLPKYKTFRVYFTSTQTEYCYRWNGESLEII